MQARDNFLYGGLMAEVLVEIEGLTSKKPGPTLTGKDYGNRSQVQGSTFRVKDKEGIEGQKSSLKMLIFPSNC